MKIVMVAVSSLNGKITRGKESHIYSWTSKEDANFFFDLVEKARLIVMGSATYESVKSIMKHKKSRLRVILTRNPKKYVKDTIENMLEFSSKDPLELVKDLENRGYKNMLLVGGNTIFLKSNLVDEIYLTLEPKIFGKGKSLLNDEDMDFSLQLLSIKKLNKQGTILLKYRVHPQV